MQTILDPESDYPSPPAYERGGVPRRIATRGDLAVVYVPSNKTVVTVLWNRKTSRE